MPPPVIPPGATTLSEADSERLLDAHGAPAAPQRDIGSPDDAVAESLGHPVAVKPVRALRHAWHRARSRQPREG